jgi:hypothetical protein
LLIGSSNQEGDEGTVWNGGHIDLNSSDLASALAISTTTNGTMVLSSTHERQVQTTPFSGDQIKSDDSVGPGRTLNWRIKPTCAPGPLHGVEITSCTATLDVTYELDLQAAQIVSGLAPTGNHPSVALSGVTTNPPNLRCRWIVKK